jgi:hypothetical protein
MSSKIAAIQRQLEKAGAATAKQPVPLTATNDAAPAEIAPAPKKKPPAPSRANKVHLGAYLTEDFKRSVMLIRAQTGKTETRLFAEALNDLFRAYNVPVIDIEGIK